MAQGEYSRIQHGFWRDPDIKRPLSPAQKCLLLYYFSSPGANMAGLYYCPLETAAAETGIRLEDVRAWTFGPLSRFVSYDETTEEVLVHRGAEHQLGVDVIAEADKRLKALLKLLNDAHSAWLRRRFWQLHETWPLGPIPDGPDEAPSKPLRSPFEANSSSSQFNPDAGTTTVTDVTEAPPRDVHSHAEGGAAPQRNGSHPPAEPTAREVNATLGPLIREHLWLGSKPPPDAPRKWSDGRDLQIARGLMKARGISLEEMVDVIRHVRLAEVDGLRVVRATEPITMRFFNEADRGHRLEDVRSYVRKRHEEQVAKQGLERIDKL